MQLHESAEALAKNGAASPDSSLEPRAHSPRCPHGQSRFGTGASQVSLRPPAQPIARHRNEENNSQRLSAIHAGACLQVQIERTPLVVWDSACDKRLTTGRTERCDFPQVPCSLVQIRVSVWKTGSKPIDDIVPAIGACRFLAADAVCASPTAPSGYYQRKSLSDVAHIPRSSQAG